MIIEEDWSFNEVNPDTVELLFPEKEWNHSNDLQTA
jgi:hypothetical protein